MKKIILLIVSVVALLSLSAAPALADEHGNSKAGSRPGLLQKFFNLRGRAAIGSGTVKSIDGDTLVVTDKDGEDHTIQTDVRTKFRRKFWGGGTLSEIQVGDTLNVIGRWTDDSKTAIEPVLIRDLSIQKRFGVFFGTISSLVSDGFVMDTESRGSQAVSISSSTRIVNVKGGAVTQVNIEVGHKVRVRGLWDKTTGTISEVKEVKDFSLR